jgi:hypothetical protein
MAGLPRGRAAGRRIFHLPQNTVARLPLRRRAQTLLGKKLGRGLAALAVGGRILVGCVQKPFRRCCNATGLARFGAVAISWHTNRTIPGLFDTIQIDVRDGGGEQITLKSSGAPHVSVP